MKTLLPHGHGRPLTWTLLLAAPLLLSPRPAAADTARTGEQIYRAQCATCHGEMGEGTDENYPHALHGNRSAEQLARLIARTMPKDAPKKLPPEDAEKVAGYVYTTFYSPEARERNKPPRIELSRLTVRQYRNAVTDLIGSFRTAGRWGEQRGLRGEYFKSRGFRNGERVLDRIDPGVKFDFGTAGPDPDKFDAAQFSIRWQGSVLAPETGEYDFIVHTEHAARLWVNDSKHPLIDAWVKSGNDTEHRASIYLLGGRVYPVRLEFSKAKQGVDDSKKKTPPKVPASITLEWKVPGRAAEPVPARCLAPESGPEVFVLATAFPPDDRSLGWERGTSVSREWDQAVVDAALEVAGYVAAHLPELSGTPDSAPDRGQRLREFGRRFAEVAFRRPLTDEQKRFFVDRQFDRAADPDTAVKRVVLLVLTSPQFLYREINGGRDAYDVASRLSFGLWDSLPDKPLLEAAAAGRLGTRAQVAGQAERMLADLRAHTKVRDFLLQYLKVDQAPDLAKDPKRFPGFDQAVISDLRTSLDLFLGDVAWGQSSDYRQLLLADSLYLNGRLAKFYGADLPDDGTFRKVHLDPGQRTGVLTHPYLLAAFAYTETSSPIHRGVFLARNVLGLSLRPPPAAFAPLAPSLHPDLTTRERVALQTRPEACQTCHGMINPLGFTLERFDAVGRLRDKENGQPINATGMYQTRTGDVVKFAGVRDLATFLAGSQEVHEAFVERLFHHLVKQPVRAFGPRTLAELRDSFEQNEFNIRKLMVEIMAVSALKSADARPSSTAEATSPSPGRSQEK
jgi:mono/diheme cytochrome c family protein